ncbi:MAG TPA: hypothetical protein PLG87_09680 [Treponemataceae bacterium]|jgi:hypothetical protein|nr:hypothetical protein [Treponemataceae bacterium]
MTGFVEIPQNEMLVVDGGGNAADAVTSALCFAAAGVCAKYAPVVAAVPFGTAILAGAAIGFAIAGCCYAYSATH